MSREASMSEAEKFRKSTAEFWLKMEGERVAARRARSPARSGNAASDTPRTPRRAAAALKAKKHRKR
jgi:hypothetical protein